MNIQIGDEVRITQGKDQGQVGFVTKIRTDMFPYKIKLPRGVYKHTWWAAHAVEIVSIADEGIFAEEQ